MRVKILLPALSLFVLALAFGSFVGCVNNPAVGEYGGEGEESGVRLAINETYNTVRKGVQLILAYDSNASSFTGTVENVTNETVPSVRVEVHLSNGKELGPTAPIDLAPGKKSKVNLSAVGQSFTWWEAHAETGASEH
ncbi:hypothetical protein H8E77_14245 [bacterium]|nr:hypothetical protein [bacterium]